MEPLELGALGTPRVLVVGAHPDDAEYYAGGTLLRLVLQGARVALTVCTGGGRGGRDLEDPVAIRAAEQAAAAEVMGFAARENLGRTDGELVVDEALRESIVFALRRERPDIVVTHDPRALFAPVRDRFRLQHSDHRATGQGTLDAIYPRAPSPNFYPKQISDLGLEPWFPREVWLMDTAEPTISVDVAKTFERKLDALRAHRSQNLDDSLVRAQKSLGPSEEFVRLVLRKGEWRSGG